MVQNLSNGDRERRLIAAAAAEANRIDAAGPTRHADPPPELPADSFEGYQITREIRRGGQAVVYQAVQKATKRKVAIKVLREGTLASPRERMRFEREVEILGQLNHPNIVTVHDSGEAASHFYYVMDYIPGQPLDVWMASGERSVDSTLKLFQVICEAVNAAHIRGVIHRDLKPGNIIIDADGRPKILDFGLAKVATGRLTQEREPQLVTVTGQFVGSLPWASPEQAGGSPDQIDVRTDVYSLGVVLYQMLTGRFPYEVVGNMRDVLDTIVRAEPVRPRTIRRQIDDEVETIVLKCLSKERDRRYQSAGELARDVERYRAGEPIEAKRDSNWYVVRKILWRHRGGAVIAAMFLILILASAITTSILYRRTAVAETVAKHQAQDATAAAAKAFAAMEALRSITDSRSGLPDRLASMHRLANTLDADFADYPDLRGALHYLLGVTYFNLGREDSTTTQALAAFDTNLEAHGPEHRDTLRSIFLLVEVLDRKGQRNEATRLMGRLVAIARRAHGDADPETLVWIGGYAGLLSQMGRTDEAQQLTEEVQHLQVGAVARNASDEFEPFKPRFDDPIPAQTLGHLHEAIGDADPTEEPRSAAPADETAPSTPDPSVHTLDNGITLVLAPMPEAGQVAVEAFYEAGFIHEPEGMTQAAHLLEHLVCNAGTAGHAPGESMALLNTRGMANAETLADWTHYDYILPAADLELAFEIEAERLASLRITDEVIEQEAPRCYSEADFVEANPRAGMLKHAFMAMNQSWRYGAETALIRGGLQDIPVADLEAFHRSVYRPERLTLIVIGRFVPDEAIEMAQRHLGSIDTHPMPAIPPIDWNVVAPEATVTWDSKVHAVSLAWAAPRDRVERIVLSFWGELLMQKLAVDRQLRQQSNMTFCSNGLWPVGELPFVVYAAAMPGTDTATLRRALAQLVQVTVDHGATAADVGAIQARVAQFRRNRSEFQWSKVVQAAGAPKNGSSRTGMVMGQMAINCGVALKTLDPDSDAQLDELTPGLLQDILERNLRPERCHIVVLGPAP